MYGARPIQLSFFLTQSTPLLICHELDFRNFVNTPTSLQYYGYEGKSTVENVCHLA